MKHLNGSLHRIDYVVDSVSLRGLFVEAGARPDIDLGVKMVDHFATSARLKGTLTPAAATCDPIFAPIPYDRARIADQDSMLHVYSAP